ncbi:MAG: glycosyltransferase family 2 protein [Alphaproteobacteria bacterium]|nr:glycosyltransferase family 2 protein [Alphaproteobacteria bacterium]
MPSIQPEITVVIPVFNEVGAIQAVCYEIKAALGPLEGGWEMIFVDDGSSDGSSDILDALAAEDPAVKVIRFRRNFGQTAALMAGFRHARGRIVVPMDGDGQNDPADIPGLVAILEDGYDVVSGWRRNRKDKFLMRRVPSVLANRMISWITGVRLNDYGCTLKAYRRDVLDRVNLYGEMHRFIPVHAYWNGARVTECTVNHRPRTTGDSKYGIGRVPRVLLDAILLYFLNRALDRPLQFFGRLGIYALLLAFLAGIWAIALKFGGTNFNATPLPLLVTMMTVLAVLCVLLGLLAELMSRVYFEGQGRTVYTIRDTRNLVRSNDCVPPDGGTESDGLRTRNAEGR